MQSQYYSVVDHHEERPGISRNLCSGYSGIAAQHKEGNFCAAMSAMYLDPISSMLEKNAALFLPLPSGIHHVSGIRHRRS